MDPVLISLGVGLAAAVLLIRMLRERLDGNREPSPRLLWASVVSLLLGAAFQNTPPAALLILGCWWGTGIFFTSRRTGIRVTVLLLLAPLPLHPTYFSPLFGPTFGEGEPSFLAYALLWLLAVGSAAVFAASTYGTIWLWDISREAVAGQRARAQLAVTQERLRFARDMHDLLGHSLSALAVKSQLAGRLVERAPDRAVAEITEVQALARQALQQVHPHQRGGTGPAHDQGGGEGQHRRQARRDRDQGHQQAHGHQPGHRHRAGALQDTGTGRVQAPQVSERPSGQQ